jgi:hypothetical protein
VAHAARHDSSQFGAVLDPNSMSGNVWTDTAYCSRAKGLSEIPCLEPYDAAEEAIVCRREQFAVPDELLDQFSTGSDPRAALADGDLLEVRPRRYSPGTPSPPR